MRYRNPVHPGYFADPFVWRHEDTFFAIGTGPSEAAGEVGSRVFPLLTSRDLTNWVALGSALVRPDASLGTSFWAPEVAYAEGRWWLYYSVGHEDRDHQLRVAVSDSPRGPWIDRAALTDLERVRFAIDPHPFRDVDGRWYLFHARDFLDVAADGSARAGTALVVHELLSMERLAPVGVTVLRARRDWQRFAANRLMYGQTYDWHTLEGPCVVQHEGRYFCLYSGGSWQTDSYGVDYAESLSVLGPWRDDGAPEQPRVLRTVPGEVIGPGHCSVVLGPDDRTHVLVYHAWDPAMRARTMRIDPLHFTAEGPRCLGPTWTERALEVHP